MRRLGTGLLSIQVLVSLALLSAAAPSWAHTESVSPASDVAVNLQAVAQPTPDGASRQFAVSAAAETPGLPWLALLSALVFVALGWRRPRRALVLAVVLLLAVFAYEDGLHSVHHLADRSQLNRCPVAAATAHLSALAVDTGGAVHVVLPVVAALTEIGQADPATRIQSPVQGRAPPATAA